MDQYKIDLIAKVHEFAQHHNTIVVETYRKDGPEKDLTYNCEVTCCKLKASGTARTKIGAKRDACKNLYPLLTELQRDTILIDDMNLLKAHPCRLLSLVANHRHDPSPLYKISFVNNVYHAKVTCGSYEASGTGSAVQEAKNSAAEAFLKKINVI